MIKNLIFFIAITVFINSKIYSVEDNIEISSDIIQTIENEKTLLLDENLNKYCNHFLAFSEILKVSAETKERLKNLKDTYTPYLEILKTFSTQKDIELALSCIFTYEFHSCFDKTSNEEFYYEITYGCRFDKTINRETFIDQLPTLIHESHHIPLLPRQDPSPVEKYLDGFSSMMYNVALDVKASSFKNKLLNFSSTITPYINVLDDLNQDKKILLAISFIFVYEYQDLFREEVITLDETSNALYQSIQPFLKIVKEVPKDKDFKSQLKYLVQKNDDLDSFMIRFIQLTGYRQTVKSHCSLLKNIFHHDSNPEEFNKKLKNLKEIFQPYQAVFKTFLNSEEAEFAIYYIFSYEFHPYFDDLSKFSSYSSSFAYKVKFDYYFDHSVGREKFISCLPTLIKKPYLKPLFCSDNEKNPSKESTLSTNLDRFYTYIYQISSQLENSPLKDKMIDVLNIFQPYYPILQGFNKIREIKATIGFIFAYEYNDLFTPELIESNEQLKSLHQNVQPYLQTIRNLPKDLDFFTELDEMVRQRSKSVFSILPNTEAENLSNFVITSFKKNHFFYFDVDRKNLKYLLQNKTHTFNKTFNFYEFCYLINQIINEDNKISHLSFMPGRLINTSLNKNDPIINHKFDENISYLRINNFLDDFNIMEVQNVLSHAINQKKNLILDLRNNPGGDQLLECYCLGFFIPDDTVMGYEIRKEHEPYLDNITFSDKDYSQKKMQNLIQTLYENWNQPLKSFEFTIKRIMHEIKEDLKKYKNQPEELLKKYSENVVNQFLKVKNINFGPQYVQGKIAILINERTGSAGEVITRFLKNHMKEKVQIIGTPSAGAVLTAKTVSFSNNDNSLESGFFVCPNAEVITTDFIRMEGNPIQPDITLTDPAEILKAAEIWIK